MKRKKLDVKKLKLDKRSIVSLDKVEGIEGGGTWQSCQPYCNTYYSCGCNPNTNYWGCTGQTQCR